MAHHQHGDTGRNSAIQAVINMLRIPSTSNMPSIGEDEVAAEADEPPDDLALFKRRPTMPPRVSSFDVKSPTIDRRESLLTRALMTSPEHSPEMTEFSGFPNITPATTSTRSSASVPSTAELTSDGGITSPDRSNPPSPPPPTTHFPLTMKGKAPQTHITIAGDAKVPTAIVPPENREATVEANLGRKRCISFACGRKAAEKPAEPKKEPVKPAEVPAAPPKRKCTLTFACPSRAQQESKLKAPSKPNVRRPSPAPMANRKPSIDSHSSLSRKSSLNSDAIDPKNLEKSEKTRFHEFEISHEEDDEWVNETTEEKPKITVNDCMKKEMAIRRIGEQAEEEAQDEDEAAADDDEEDDDNGLSDKSSDDGNESDDEGGFADSDDESDAGSDYHFWAPSTTTAATSTDHLEHIRPNPHRSASETSLESMHRREAGRVPIFRPQSPALKKRQAKLPRFRPGTPDLPDSTDFVCGTLDEDRPLEAAYMSCLEERRRSKYVPIPQDIDPSFPTSDPDVDDDDDDDEALDDADGMWIKGGMEGVDESAIRGRRRSTDHTVKSLSHSPNPLRSPPARKAVHRSPPPLRRVGTGQSPKRLRSPPPPLRLKSPPPIKRLRSPPPPLRLKSPPPIKRTILTISPTRQAQAVRITGRLNQGCDLVHTKSLPRTPNPFFARPHRPKDISDGEDLNLASPKTKLPRRRPSHTRGPIDIVEGLEKKRQKRAEKFWRQHCRKAAKEEQQRKPIPGKGYERMKEIGLEVAERTKGYGLGQTAPLVLSI